MAEIPDGSEAFYPEAKTSAQAAVKVVLPNTLAPAVERLVVPTVKTFLGLVGTVATGSVVTASLVTIMAAVLVQTVPNVGEHLSSPHLFFPNLCSD